MCWQREGKVTTDSKAFFPLLFWTLWLLQKKKKDPAHFKVTLELIK